MRSRFLSSIRNSSLLPKLRTGCLWVLALGTFPQYFGGAMQAQAAPGSFEDLALRATAAREGGRAEEALRSYRQALAIRPDWEEGWWFLGTLEYDGDDFARAIPALGKVVELDPGNGPAWDFLGLCEFETFDYRNSLEHLRKGQELGAGEDMNLERVSEYHLALLLDRNGEFEKAFAILTSTFRDHAPAEAKTALGLSLLRIPLLPRELDPSRDSLVVAAGETASVLAGGDPRAATHSFEQLLENSAGTPYLHYAFGRFLASSGRVHDALVEEQAETRASPRSPLPYIEISSLNLRLGNPEGALRAAETAVKIAPESAESHRALADSLGSAGEREKAAAERKTAEALSAEGPAREARIIQLYAAKDAAGEVRPATDRSGDQARIAREALAAQSAGNAELAIRLYQQGTEANPEWDEGWWNLGALDYSAGSYPDAISALKRYVGIRPENGTAWAMMGLSEYETRDYASSLVHLERGQELGMRGSKESVELARCRLAGLLNRKGEFERAEAILAHEAGSGPLRRDARLVLGMSLLRMALLPDQVETSKQEFVASAGELAALLHESQYDQALSRMKVLLRDHPSVPFLHYAYGSALADLSRYDEAEPELREEIRISPNSELSYLALASLALKTRRAADAIPWAEDAVKLAPNSAKARYTLGRAYLDLSRNEKAVEALEAASRLAPDSPEVHFNLAKAYRKLNQAEKADREQRVFLRLNALAELERTSAGSDVYMGPRGASDFRAPSESAATPPQETHP